MPSRYLSLSISLNSFLYLQPDIGKLIPALVSLCALLFPLLYLSSLVVVVLFLVTLLVSRDGEIPPSVSKSY